MSKLVLSAFRRGDWRICTCLALLAGPLLAAQSARQIAEMAQEKTTSSSEHYEGTLRVEDYDRSVSTKEWIFERIGSHGASKALIRFTSPAEVDGVALLIFNYPDRTSDQWMWTPALQRTRRVAAQNRGARFFGTDFSFEDLDERDVEQYSYELLGEEKISGVDCWKLSSEPAGKKTSQYSKSHIWIQKGNYAVRRMDHYDDDKLVRRILYDDLQEIQGIWTPMKVEVRDLERNSRTIMAIQDVAYNQPLKESEFSTSALRRLR